MMGYIWFAIIFVAICFAAALGTMADVTTAIFDSAKAAVTLAIGLVGAMALFLGAMKVAQDAGLLRVIARLIRPVMVRLFPDVPADHPAMGAMIMNMSANMLGLANAATPFGIKAMMELDRLNPRKGTATDAMALFLAINTSNVTLLPTGVMAIRHAAESQDVGGIILPTWFATFCSTAAAIVAAKLYQRIPGLRWVPPTPEELAALEAADGGDGRPGSPAGGGAGGGGGGDAGGETGDADAADGARVGVVWQIASWVLIALLISFGLTQVILFVALGQAGYTGGLTRVLEAVSPWVIPMVLLAMLGYGLAVQLWDRFSGAEPRLEIYQSFIDGAKEGFGVALKIIPYLVAILVAVGMFRASGGLDMMTAAVSPLLAPLGMPAEALPMALLRPLSGSGAFGYMTEVVNANGPDTYLGYLVSTMQGSTETTFYVVAVYFGAVQVNRLRHTIPACLTADLVGVAATVLICSLLFGALA